MARKLPPLNALRAFEAAARHGSLTKAAEELSVTPSAVGHQVRALEHYLGVRLFLRQKGTFRLTPGGTFLCARVKPGFDCFALAADALMEREHSKYVIVGATPALALRWLAPALDEFRRNHPAVELRIDSSSRGADLEGGDVDIDIRYCVVPPEGYQNDLLLAEAVVPVCHPSLLRQDTRFDLRALLARDVVLQVSDWACRGGVWDCWGTWLSLQGLPTDGCSRGPRYSSIDDAISAAARCEGYAMATAWHLRQEELRGRIVECATNAVNLQYTAQAVTLPELSEFGRIRLVRTWLHALAAKTDPHIIHEGSF